MNDYFIDPLGRGPKSLPPPPPPPPHQHQHALFNVIMRGGAGGKSNSGRGAVGATMMTPIFPDSGFESSHLDDNDYLPIMQPQPQHILASQHRATPTAQQHYPHQQQQWQRQLEPPIQVPATANSRHYSPNDEIPPSPMQVHMSSTTSNKNINLSGGATRPNNHIHDEQSFHYDTIPPSSAHHFQYRQETRSQHQHQHHHHYPSSSQHHSIETNTNSYHQHPQQMIVMENEDHSRRTVERTPLEFSRQYYPHEQQQQQQRRYNHPRSTQSDPPRAPPPASQITINPQCRLVSSDSETIFHRNGYDRLHNSRDKYTTTQRTASNPSRNPPPSFVGVSSNLRCGEDVVGEDHRFCHEDLGYHHHNHQPRHDNRKCTGDSWRCHHLTHPHRDIQVEHREYDPSMDVRLYGRADSYYRNELREPPPPPSTSSLPLSPLTMPSVVNSPAMAEYRRYGFPQCSTDATCSEGESHKGDGVEKYTPSYNDNFHNGLDRKVRYCGYPSHPHTTPKIMHQDNCHCCHDRPTDEYYHRKHPFISDPARKAQMREVYLTTKYDDPLPQQRDDFYSESSTAYYRPDPKHHPPPPPLPQSPPPDTSRHHYYCDHTLRQAQCSHPNEKIGGSRLSIEIPNSPPHIPNQHTATTTHSLPTRSPTQLNIRGSRSRTPTRSTSTARTNRNHRNAPSSSSTFAEYEKRQSEARQQLLREISQATTMRNSALDDEDRKFWERQIDTLNQTFRKL